MRVPEKRSVPRALAFSAALTAHALSAWGASQVNIKVQNASTLSREDSLALVQKSRQDSLAMAQKARQDSLAMAGRASRDSLAMEETLQLLEQEKARRSEMENQLLTTGLLVLDAVYFETGKTDISINSKPYLDMLAKMLAKYPKLKIEVAGHTDNVGSDSYNLTLSQGRAMAVKDYLVGQVPDLGARLTAKGYGESTAKADNNSAEGRKLNRRTELQVLNKEALQEYAEEPARTGEPARTSGTAPVPGDHRGGTTMEQE